MTESSTTAKRTLGVWIRWVVLPLLLGGATMVLIAKAETKAWEVEAGATFTNLADDLLVVDAHGLSVRLRISATPSTFETALATKILCRFDLTGLGPGRHVLPVQGADIRLPEGIQLLAPVTPTLAIQLEKGISKTVDVVAELEGGLPPGVAVAAVHVIPDRVRLTGTAALLIGIETVKTHPISLTGAAESFKKEVPLNLPPSIIADPPSRIVVAEVEIQERLITRRLENIPVQAQGTAAGVRIDPQGITLTINGPEAIVGVIESDPAFSVTIDLEGLAPGSHSLKAAIKLPLHTTLVQVSPELFSVTIGRK